VRMPGYSVPSWSFVHSSGSAAVVVGDRRARGGHREGGHSNHRGQPPRIAHGAHQGFLPSRTPVHRTRRNCDGYTRSRPGSPRGRRRVDRYRCGVFVELDTRGPVQRGAVVGVCRRSSAPDGHLDSYPRRVRSMLQRPRSSGSARSRPGHMGQGHASVLVVGTGATREEVAQTWSGPRAVVPGWTKPRGSGAGWLRGIRQRAQVTPLALLARSHLTCP